MAGAKHSRLFYPFHYPLRYCRMNCRLMAVAQPGYPGQILEKPPGEFLGGVDYGAEKAGGKFSYLPAGVPVDGKDAPRACQPLA
ncbi:hypothetical protein [Pseudoduganella sp.]|uniref:hypothetical protein n=1 Tax=Pseudoduganella sp. TaxID=1880898 RepID=UPI0035AEFEF0